MTKSQTFYAIKLDDDSYARLVQEEETGVFNYSGPLSCADLLEEKAAAISIANGINGGKDKHFYVLSKERAVSIVRVELIEHEEEPLTN